MSDEKGVQGKMGQIELGDVAPARADDRCTGCDDTGDMHRADGEWMGYCSCPAGKALRNRPPDPPQPA